MQNNPDPLAPPADVPQTPPPVAPVSGAASAMPNQQPAMPVQQPMQAQPVQSASPTSQGMPQPGMPQPGAPLPSTNKNLIKIILIAAAAVLGITAITFIGLFIRKNQQYIDASTDVNGQINRAVSDATMALDMKKENEFAEREKEPYTTFTAPEDYGGLSFEYPKTYSVYVAKDANDNKGDFEAYLNPGLVSPISATTINAVRVTIKSQTFEKTITEYDKLVEKGSMFMEVRTLDNERFPGVRGDTYNLYRGELPSKLRGAVAIFKVRDKSFIIQTDAEVFLGENNDGDFFNPVLSTIHYNK